MFIVSILVILLFAQVIFRYVLNNSLSWTEEIVRFLLIWSSFLSASLGVWYKGHLGIKYFINKFPKNTKNVALILVHVSTIVFLVVAFIASIKVIQISSGISLISVPLMWSYAFISFPIGIGLSILYYVDLIIQKRAE